MIRRLPWLLLILLVALAQDEERFSVELKRKDKTVISQLTSDDANSFWAAQYGDIVVGKLEKLEGKLVSLAGKTYWSNEESRLFRESKETKLEGFKASEWVELSYNKDFTDKDGRFYIMRLAQRKGPPEGEGAKKKKYNRLVLWDKAKVKVQFGKDATAYGPLAQVDQGVEENVTLSDGKAELLKKDPNDINEEGKLVVEPKTSPQTIEVFQGKSKAKGSRLVYSNDTGDANLSGPITLDRSGDKPLTGESRNLVYNVDDEVLKLTGNIKMVQDGRTTTASSAIVIEKEGFAYLYGTEKEPVRSEKAGKEKVQGEKVRYNLDSGDVEVVGKVSGEVEEE